MLTIITILALIACNSNDVNKDVNKKEATNNNETKETQEEKLDKQIEIGETLEFEQFNIEFDNIKAYEDDGKLLLELNFSWRNKQLPDGSTLYVATLFEATQNGEELVEINDSWNPEGDRSLHNDVFLNNAAGGLSPVKLTYELKNAEKDVELIFTPTTETEDSQSITVNLK